ncbi:undecaprenyl-diphosphate phosphatase [Candidatus Micrarchaeota archaeon]|nr:undecaprenyl-diphosphate phosphatase [Candidatus Micrarchaeota archaeon]
MDILQAIFLGLIQGFTEWLPISSSGHLVVAQALLGIQTPPEFDIIIMIGTTLALLVYLRNKIISLLLGAVALKKDALNYIALIILAGIPTAIIGFAGRVFFKGLFTQPLTVSLLIVVTGIFLLIASRFAKYDQRLSPSKAALIGLAQGIAVAPGISRSGSTIGAGWLLGLNPLEAAEFSFFIGAPAMAVASIIEYLSINGSTLDLNLLLPSLIAGTIAAFITGYLSIGFLMKILEAKKLYLFGYYCIIAGITFAVIIYSLSL